jgi:hypothetical protein
MDKIISLVKWERKTLPVKIHCVGCQEEIKDEGGDFGADHYVCVNKKCLRWGLVTLIGVVKNDSK